MDPRFVLVELPLAQMVMTTRAAESRPAAPDPAPVLVPVPGPVPVPVPVSAPTPRSGSRPVRPGPRRGVPLWALRLRASLSRWA